VALHAGRVTSLVLGAFALGVLYEAYFWRVLGDGLTWLFALGVALGVVWLSVTVARSYRTPSGERRRAATVTLGGLVVTLASYLPRGKLPLLCVPAERPWREPRLGVTTVPGHLGLDVPALVVDSNTGCFLTPQYLGLPHLLAGLVLFSAAVVIGRRGQSA